MIRIRIRNVVRAAALVATMFTTSAFTSHAAAQAEDTPGLLEQLVSLRKAGNDTQLAGLLAEVPASYKSSTAAQQGKLRSELGKIAGAKSLGSARTAAVKALTMLEDPKKAWKTLATLLPKPKTESASAFDLAVVRAAGALAQAKAGKTLLDLVAKAKDPQLAAAAALALGGFHANGKQRVKLLGDAVTLGRRLAPAQSADESGTPTAARKRWVVVGPALVEGLNQLTGREFASFDQWVALWTENKKNLAAIFPPGDE